LNYNEEDFIIDLSDILQWLGFSKKDKCKDLLINNFVLNIDYKSSSNNVFPLNRENSNLIKNVGGRPSETILMTINTFKELCIKANTQKAKNIRTYFIKLEKIIFEIINEEAKDLKELIYLKKNFFC
jgi:phage anti-repressor protein